jgi:4-amino-4-deoxy-L-arabinose transferase-like glycosyltransferase
MDFPAGSARDHRVERPFRLPFSFPAFLLAPWPVPLFCSAEMVIENPGRQPVMFFFICLGVSLVISYLGTATLVVALHFVAQARPVTKTASALTGLALAAAGYLPFAFMNWKSSGPDSGPPLENFGAYLLHNWNDPILGIFLAGGLVAALLYDTLARRFNRQASPA